VEERLLEKYGKRDTSQVSVEDELPTKQERSQQTRQTLSTSEWRSDDHVDITV
jgi:hypothetical protein